MQRFRVPLPLSLPVSLPLSSFALSLFPSFPLSLSPSLPLSLSPSLTHRSKEWFSQSVCCLMYVGSRLQHCRDCPERANFSGLKTLNISACEGYLAPQPLKGCDSPVCRNRFDMSQSQQLRSSFKLFISFTFSSLMFKISDSERLDKFSEVSVEF